MKNKIIILVFFLFVSNVFAMDVSAKTVIYNVKTHKYHSVSCRWAKKCTKNCIKIEKSRAKVRGGIPCKVCGG